MSTILDASIDTLRRMQSREIVGSVASVRGLSLLVNDLPVPMGSLVRVTGRNGVATEPPIRGEVIGFDAARSVVMLFDGSEGIAPGMRVIGEQAAPTVAVGRCLLGRIIDGLGRPIDGRGWLRDTVTWPLHAAPTCPMRRTRIATPLPTGVRVIDAMLTLGKGQRVGIFSGPGVGKSTLLANVARHTVADVSVIALVGERGREVRDFIEGALGPEGLERSVLVVATSDASPLLRVRAAALACAVAEFFRDIGADVMLIMDSITRFAQAQRQIGLTVGEQPATKGYTPSVFAMMPKILERAGAIDGGGSITGLYSVLVEGDDLTEPVSDAARGILDGHIALSRRLAARGHFPAVDLLESISRVADDVCDSNHVDARRTLRRLVAVYAEAEELINIGAYARGANVDTDVAVAMKTELDTYLQQTSGDPSPYPETCRRLIELSLQAGELANRPPPPAAGMSAAQR